jgi:preprotein translocase subunit SecF
MFEIFRNINIDWMGKRKVFIAFSIVILLAGLISAIGRNLMPGGSDAFNLGVDFKGGTVVTAKFRQKPSADQIRSALQTVGIGETTIQDSTDKPDEFLIKVPVFETVTEGQATDTEKDKQSGRDIVKKALDTFGKEAIGGTQ